MPKRRPAPPMPDPPAPQHSPALEAMNKPRLDAVDWSRIQYERAQRRHRSAERARARRQGQGQGNSA